MTAPAGTKPRDLKGVVRGTESRERHAAVRGRHVERVVQILDDDRNAQQRLPSRPSCARCRRPAPVQSRCSRRSRTRGSRIARYRRPAIRSRYACVISSEVVTPDFMSARNWAIVLPTTSYLTLVSAGSFPSAPAPATTSSAFFRSVYSVVVEAVSRQRGDVEVVDRANLCQPSDRRSPAPRRGCSRWLRPMRARSPTRRR